VSKKKRQRQGRASSRRNQRSSLIIPVIVGVVVIAIIIGAILFIEGGQSTPSAVAGELTSQGSTVGPLDTSALPYPDVPRISLDETHEKLAQGQAILVDVRSKESFNKAHAAGAISVPEEEIAARLNELPQDKELILYCT
jgi:3-mercaptopyruvate sulfurtransferase SseA